ncbi:gluconate 2-dehydrogenase subunit 3 family protein [Parasediminibacterium sp. JCM 36343]|uniref:gluconate 2-dehydrogenase subunit 3 family protein n=1 Tax=Parasediminibacterium sp. JCM 36343 TaxID=3374279 RepID=UPI0039791544
MRRREAISRLGILSGAALLGTTGLLSSCHFADKKRTTLTEKDIPLLDEIGETIIPETATSPGAKAAKIGAYMVLMVNDCYNAAQQKLFLEGLDSFEAASQLQYKASFLELSPADKKKFLMQLDKEATKIKNKKSIAPQAGEHYFAALKRLTYNGYVTSEVGATKALRYDPIPGKYEGSVPCKKDEKPWATS